MSPIYELECGVCGKREDRILPFRAGLPLCCGETMYRLPTFPVMVKVMGEGGYPSRRKFLRGSAPGTSREIHPWFSYDPSDTSYDQLGRKKKDAGESAPLQSV